MCWYRRFIDPWCLICRMSSIDIGVRLCFASVGWRYYSLFPRWIGKVLPLGQLVPRRGTEVVSALWSRLILTMMVWRGGKVRIGLPLLLQFEIVTEELYTDQRGRLMLLRRQHSHANSFGCRVLVTHRGRFADNGILRIVRGLDAAHNLSS